ncbi:MAG: phBC6A51 family helix-turn-helix protein [Bacteroidota bacterium]|nr:phBC6A51 family helix-turn-helix protein [Bacteroidota bacterium]
MSNLVKKRDLLKKANLKKLRAIDILGTQPDVTGVEICKELDISKNTLTEWKKDIAFVEAVYEKYMITFNSKLPAVLEAMIREAKEGNVQAGKLVMEVAGKIVKRVNVKIQAPFQQWLDAKDADIVDINEEIPTVGFTPMEAIKTIEVKEENLPKRNKNNDKPIKRSMKEKKKIEKIKKNPNLLKKKKDQFNSWYHLRKRAKKVGLDLLPPGKPTKTQRAEWLAKLESLEKG